MRLPKIYLVKKEMSDINKKLKYILNRIQKVEL